jgi:hypothetical protein
LVNREHISSGSYAYDKHFNLTIPVGVALLFLEREYIFRRVKMPENNEQGCVEVYEVTIYGGWLKLCRAFCDPVDVIHWIQRWINTGKGYVVSSIIIYSMPLEEWQRTMNKLGDGRPGVPVFTTEE